MNDYKYICMEKFKCHPACKGVNFEQPSCILKCAYRSIPINMSTVYE